MFKKDSKQALRIKRVVDAYRNISLDGVEFRVPNATPRKSVVIHIIPDMKNNLVILRFWQGISFLGQLTANPDDIKRVRF